MSSTTNRQAPTVITTEKTAIIVPPGTVIAPPQLVRFVPDFFENQGDASRSLLNNHFPTYEDISWSLERISSANNFSLSTRIAKGTGFQRSVILDIPLKKDLLRIQSGNVTSLMLSKNDLLLPGVHVEGTLRTPSVPPYNFTADLGAKARPLGLSTNIRHDIQSGLLSGWLALYHAVQHFPTGNQIGVGGKGEFVGNDLKSAQFAATFRRNTFESVASVSLTNRTKPSVASLSFFDTFQIRNRPFDATVRFDHDLETESTLTSVGILDRTTRTKARINTNGLLGFASTLFFYEGLVQVIFGFDFDIHKNQTASTLKVTMFIYKQEYRKGPSFP